MCLCTLADSVHAEKAEQARHAQQRAANDKFQAEQDEWRKSRPSREQI
jgi:hypothetical protein|eukprot:SAG25_NODE_662_length_6079_cov_46.887793_3_plen_48_part_00